MNMSPSERELLRNDIREFKEMDAVCFCCATSHPPCSVCTHPGNVTSAEIEEIGLMEHLEDARFLPGDVVYLKKDVEILAAGDRTHQLKGQVARKTIAIVGIDQEKDEVLQLVPGGGEMVKAKNVIPLEDVKRVATEIAAQNIVKIQSFAI